MEVEATENMEPVNNAAPSTEKIEILEGSARIQSENRVFYNPVQEFNRDISISVLATFWQLCQRESEQRKTSNAKVPGGDFAGGLRVLEALSATGLRSIRYAKEVPGITQIIANDLSPSAVISIKENIALNGVEHLIEASESNATTLMYNSTMPDKRFQAIDLDPYGNPTIFLDGAVQSIADGGILLITATDMAVLAGNSPESCYYKYGSISLKTKACHEQGLRILLRCIESHANRYGRYIKPLLSISVDFYIRVFVRVYTSARECKLSSSKQSMLYQCSGCTTFTLQPLGVIKPNPTESNPKQFKYCLPLVPAVNEHCEYCEHQHHVGGPIWHNPIHDLDFVDMLYETIQTEPFKQLGTFDRIQGILAVVREELPDAPLYYANDHICSVLRLQTIPVLKFRSALLHAGYRVSFSHACKTSIKTDAPSSVLWDILRSWSKRYPPKSAELREKNPVIGKILSKEPTKEYNFDEIHEDANPDSRRMGLRRYQMNPTAHWGPGTRSTLMVDSNPPSKSLKNQNKHKERREAQEAKNGGEVKRPKVE